ncbi:MAG TPA: SWIM zinc finger family protein [Verrucomicrobiales bacterium]|jgi:hypothetical protein|nr:SWIM zinc finger family protein [Verrucomicrobiales bacterium]
MPLLTVPQVLALSPDDASAKAARGLVKPAKWVTLGAAETGLWGECQGSGAKPYQVMVDASGFGTKCSCPSRKFPCKHGLALMLMHAEGTGKFAGDPPVWFSEWLSGRKERAEKQAAKKEAAAEAPPPDPAKAAKRQEARLDRMRAGASWLGLWMRDLVREGLADLPSRPSSFWRETAARMVDAQTPGLGRRVEEMESLLYSGTDWPVKLLAAMGRTQLLLDALEKFDALPAGLQADVRTALGWAQEKDAALTGEKVEDLWTVNAVVYEENGPLHERRVWLSGNRTGRAALLLDFSHGGRKFEMPFVHGTQMEAALTYFPAAAPLRAVPGEMKGPAAAAAGLAGGGSFGEALEGISGRMAANPWLQRHPVALRGAKVRREGTAWGMQDSAGADVPVRLPEAGGWMLAAVSGGEPVDVFGEWAGGVLYPLTACCSGWISLTD